MIYIIKIYITISFHFYNFYTILRDTIKWQQILNYLNGRICVSDPYSQFSWSFGLLLYQQTVVIIYNIIAHFGDESYAMT